MLGEKIGESKGKVTSQRILKGEDYRYLRMEVTVQEEATIFGQQGMNIGTYTVYERVPGQLYGEGQGILGTNDGQSAIWNGHGVGQMTGQGMGMSFRFSIAVQAGAEGKLAQLNKVLIIGEHDVDDAGNTKTAFFEWK